MVALLPEALLLQACSLLDVTSLERARAVSPAMRNHCSADVLWQPLCCQRWSSKSKGAVRKFHESQSLGWRQRYLAAEADSRRNLLSGAEELHDLRFDFRFRGEPHTVYSRNFRFCDDGLVYGHPNPDLHYTWRILRDGKYVQLGPFPRARVRRTKTWGWALCNANIVCISVDEADDDSSSGGGGGGGEEAQRQDLDFGEDAECIRNNAELFHEDSWQADDSEEDEDPVNAADDAPHRAVRLPDGRIAVLPPHVWNALFHDDEENEEATDDDDDDDDDDESPVDGQQEAASSLIDDDDDDDDDGGGGGVAGGCGE